MIKYTEKRISSLLFVTLISLPTLAQNIQGSYRPKADGEIRKQQESDRGTLILRSDRIYP